MKQVTHYGVLCAESEMHERYYQHQYNYTYGTRTITQTSKDVKCIMKLAAG